jgi:hypothetical protein
VILNDPKSVVEFQPDKDSPIVYLLKVPTVVDRVRYRRAVRAEGGKAWSELQMLEAMEDGLRKILVEPEDQQKLEELVAAIVTYRGNISEVLDEFRKEIIEEESSEDQVEFIRGLVARMEPPVEVREIERIVFDHYLPYAEMVADRDVFQEISGLVASRMFLAGWKGLDVPFKRTKTGVSDEMLGHLPRIHLAMIGAHVQQMMEPNINQLKKSPSRSGGRGDPDRSSGIETPQESDPSRTITGPAPNSGLTNSEFTH